MGVAEPVDWGARRHGNGIFIARGNICQSLGRENSLRCEMVLKECRLCVRTGHSSRRVKPRSYLSLDICSFWILKYNKLVINVFGRDLHTLLLNHCSGVNISVLYNYLNIFLFLFQYFNHYWVNIVHLKIGALMTRKWKYIDCQNLRGIINHWQFYFATGYIWNYIE